MLSKTDWLTKTDWLIEQQIARYFTILSTVICRNKICLLTRSPFCKYEWGRRGQCRWFSFRGRNWLNKAEDKEGPCKIQTMTAGEGTAVIKLKKKIMTFASHFSFIFIVFAHENSWLCLGIFSSREICRKPTGQNTAGSFLINFTSHAIKRRQHSI